MNVLFIFRVYIICVMCCEGYYCECAIPRVLETKGKNTDNITQTKACPGGREGVLHATVLIYLSI